MISIQQKTIGYDTPNRDKFNAGSIAAGFQMTFANGNTISVQFGMGNYCNNRNCSKSDCEDAEIAIWNKLDKLYDFGGDEVKGYCSTDEVAYYINLAATLSF